MNADVLKKLKVKARERWVAEQPAVKELTEAVQRATEAKDDAWRHTGQAPAAYILGIQKASRYLSKERRRLEKLTRELDSYFDHQVRAIRPDS